MNIFMLYLIVNISLREVAETRVFQKIAFDGVCQEGEEGGAYHSRGRKRTICSVSYGGDVRTSVCMLVRVCVLFSHLTVVSTLRHQYTQRPC